MNKDTLRQIAVIVAVVAVIVVNGLANALPLNDLTTGEISDRFDVYFVPAGYVFSIWGLIYLGLVIFAVYQALPAQRDHPRLRRIGGLFLLSCVANIAWLFLWHYERFPLTLVAMVVLLLSLIAIYLHLGIGRYPVSATETWCLRVPFSIYLGWITVATIANVTSLLDYLDWGGWGIAPQTWAVIILGVATAIAAVVALTRADLPFLMVLAWAFAGIAIKHVDTTAVTVAAWVATGLVIVLMVIAIFAQGRRREQFS